MGHLCDEANQMSLNWCQAGGERGLQINGRLSRFLSAAACKGVCAHMDKDTHTQLFDLY